VLVGCVSVGVGCFSVGVGSFEGSGVGGQSRHKFTTFVFIWFSRIVTAFESPVLIVWAETIEEKTKVREINKAADVIIVRYKFIIKKQPRRAVAS